jgi:predicted hotdog family 3-hydroxylacyl-ACP dehydratase
MSAAGIPLDELIAHRAPMCLLDRMLHVTDREARAEAVVRADNPLFVPGRGLPAYVGLEMMAQAIAAIDGMKRKIEKLPPKIGFLLGCRRYSASRAEFAEGERLSIAANMVFGDNAMFAFECRIDGEDGSELAKANMSVYAPADPNAFLKGGTP